jgi:hypothetical protein
VISAEDTTGTVVSAIMKIEVDFPIGVLPIDVSESILLYPNPSSGEIITIETRGLYDDAGVILRNQNGVAVYISRLSGRKAEIPVDGLPAGMYTVTVIGNNSTFHSKLIVQ